MFGTQQAAAAQLPKEPPPPPNPPMFGSNSTGTSQVRKQTQANSGFGSTFIGGAQAPATTGQKALLGS